MKNDPYIVAEFLKAKDREDWSSQDGTHPFVTISRQRGAGGDLIALRTAEILTEMSHSQEPWVVVDKNLAGWVMKYHHLPQEITHFLTDEQTLSVENHIEGMLGINVSSRTLMEKMRETIVHLARIGHMIFVGRAAHVITAKFPRAVHVRIIGSFERRVERVMEKESCSRQKAEAEIRRVDQNRRHFVATHFNVDVEDTSKYDMVFNTDRLSVEEAAQVIARLVSSPTFREKEVRQLTELRHRVLG
jgi:cytidylate kinase